MIVPAGRFLMILGGALLALQAALPCYVVSGPWGWTTDGAVRIFGARWSGTFSVLSLCMQSPAAFLALIPNALGLWVALWSLLGLPKWTQGFYRGTLALIVVPTTLILILLIIFVVGGLTMGWLSMTSDVLVMSGAVVLLSLLCWDGLSMLFRSSLAGADPTVKGLLNQALLLLFMSPLAQIWLVRQHVEGAHSEPTGAIWVAVAGWMLALVGIYLSVRGHRRRASAGVGAPSAQDHAP